MTPTIEPVMLPKLIELPIEKACNVKWKIGRAKYGDKFVGNPIEELYGELIDGLNYCDEGELQGFAGTDVIRGQLLALCTAVKFIYEIGSVEELIILRAASRQM